jgi:two-component system NtrC family sensor kinase
MANDKPASRHIPERNYSHFRRLWNNVVIALLAAAFIPLLAIGGGMYYYSNSTLKDSTLASLRNEVYHHRKTVDQFLFERIMDLTAISQNHDLASITAPGKLESVFKAIQPDARRYYADLGVIDRHGDHRVYVGSYDMMANNYSDAQWFKEAMASGTCISDVFSGFRKEPHFVIAVKRTENGNPWIIRATMDASYFTDMVATVSVAGQGTSFLVNEKGLLQTAAYGVGGLMEPSGVGNTERFDGIRVAHTKGKIRVMTWLKSVPWLSIIEMDRGEIFKLLRRVRHVGIFILILGTIIIILTVLPITNHLVGRLEFKRRSIRLMGHHLRQANKMTLSLQLQKGFFQEINEALANIDSSAVWVSERVRKIHGPPEVTKDVDGQIQQIRSQIVRSRKTVDEIIRFSLPAVPAIDDIAIDTLLERLVALFRLELHYNNIHIHRDFQKRLPSVRSDGSLLNQVFQNLMFNAVDAAGENGTICLKTAAHKDSVSITITDDGAGIAPEMADKIFDPLFTTNDSRLGLGLSICRDILEQIGGRIEVDAPPGKGAGFTVTLPVYFKSP